VTEHAGYPLAATTAVHRDDSLVAQSTTTPFIGRVRAPEQIGDTARRHMLRPTSLRGVHCVPSDVVVRARLSEPCPAATGGAGFAIETGSEAAIGFMISRKRTIAVGTVAGGATMESGFNPWRLHGCDPYGRAITRMNRSPASARFRLSIIGERACCTTEYSIAGRSACSTVSSHSRTATSPPWSFLAETGS
jgi:hypothetical protein